MMRAVDHDAGVAIVDAGLDQIERVAMVAVNGDRQRRIFLHGGVDDGLEIADVGVFAGTLADLKDQRAFLLGAGIDDGLAQLHVVDIERADGKSAAIGEIEHRLGGHQRHRTSPVGPEAVLVDSISVMVSPPSERTAQQFRGCWMVFQMAELARSNCGNTSINRLRAMISCTPASRAAAMAAESR